MANLVEFQEYGVDHKARNLNGVGVNGNPLAPFFGSLEVGKPTSIASFLKLDQDRAIFHEQSKRDVFQHRAVNLGLGAGNDRFNKVATLGGNMARGPKAKFLS